MNINNVNYANKLKTLRVDLGGLLVVGSGILALLELKSNDDLDLWATEKVFKSLKTNKLWKPIMKHGRLFYEADNGNIEVSNTFPCTKGRVEDYLKRAIKVSGINFKSIDDVIAWKKCMGRPKDFEHIKLLEKYKRKNMIEIYLKSLL